MPERRNPPFQRVPLGALCRTRTGDPFLTINARTAAARCRLCEMPCNRSVSAAAVPTRRYPASRFSASAALPCRASDRRAANARRLRSTRARTAWWTNARRARHWAVSQAVASQGAACWRHDDTATPVSARAASPRAAISRRTARPHDGPFLGPSYVACPSRPSILRTRKPGTIRPVAPDRHGLDAVRRNDWARHFEDVDPAVARGDPPRENGRAGLHARAARDSAHVVVVHRRPSPCA